MDHKPILKRVLTKEMLLRAMMSPAKKTPPLPGWTVLGPYTNLKEMIADEKPD